MTNVIPLELIDRTPLVNVNYSGSPLKLSSESLRHMYDLGLLTARPYAILAILFDGVGKDEEEAFDIEDFIDRWEGTENDKGKSKRLKTDDVIVALNKLQSLGYGKVKLVPHVKLDIDSIL